tara:strand:- start:62 stop:319 length:258 start_codon:yes stop_codon:yes gene_type:complete
VLGHVEKLLYIVDVIMRDMRDILKLVPYIGVGVVVGALLLVLPAIIRGFFSLLLFGMTNPLESLVIMGVALLSYSVGLYLGERNL